MERKTYSILASFFVAAVNIAFFASSVYLNFNGNWGGLQPALILLAATLNFTVFYLILCRIYNAFSFAASSIMETAMTQMLCFFIADAATYFEILLLTAKAASFGWFVLLLLAQFLITLLLTLIAKRFFVAYLEPKEILMVSDRMREEIVRMENRIMDRYGHLMIFTDCSASDADDLSEKIEKYPEVFLYGVSPERREKVIRQCIAAGKVYYLVPEVSDISVRYAEIKHYTDAPVYRIGVRQMSAGYLFWKRFFDIVLSVVALAVAAPFMLIIAAAIKIEDRGPVFFTQKRVTRDGKIFTIYKFRSMIVRADQLSDGPVTVNDPRITRVGKVIRKIRLDELPQFFNILKGDMSFVGPRPERVELYDIYCKQYPEFQLRQKVKSGLTGYAQVYGKYNTTPEDKLKLDLLYIGHCSLWEDFKILLLTVKVLFLPESTEGFTEKAGEEFDRKVREEKNHEE